MLCPSCGYQVNEKERQCSACGMLLVNRRKARKAAFIDPLFEDGTVGEAPLIRELYKDNGLKAAVTPPAKQGAAKQQAAAKQQVAAKQKVSAEEAAARKTAAAAEKEAAKKQEEAKEAAAKQAAAARAVEKAKDDIEKAIKEAAERTAAKKAAVKRAEAKRAAEKAAAARKAVEKFAQGTTPKKAAEEAAAKKAAQEAAAKKAAQEAAAKKAAQEAAAKRAAEEAAAKKAAEEAAAKKAAEEAAAKKAAEEAAAKRAAQEAAAKRAAEEAAAKKAAQEMAAKRAAEEAAAKKAAQEAAAKRAAEEAAAKKAAEEAAAKKAAEEAAEKKKAAQKNDAKTAQPLADAAGRIAGDRFPYVSITMDENQGFYTQSDVMVWMSAGIAIETRAKPFAITYTAKTGGQEIVFASPCPGEILERDIGSGGIIIQKSAFLAAGAAVELSSHITMHLGDDQTGGHLVFQRLAGDGKAYIAVGGSVIAHALQPGEVIKADAAGIAAFEESVSFQTEMLSGFQNTHCGAQALFIATLTGPGSVWLQTIAPRG